MEEGMRPMLSKAFSGSALARGSSYVVNQSSGVKMEPMQHPEMNIQNMSAEEVEQALVESCLHILAECITA